MRLSLIALSACLAWLVAAQSAEARPYYGYGDRYERSHANWTGKRRVERHYANNRYVRRQYYSNRRAAYRYGEGRQYAYRGSVSRHYAQRRPAVTITNCLEQRRHNDGQPGYAGEHRQSRQHYT